VSAQPELTEPRLEAPGLTDLSLRDWRAVFVRAAKRMLDDNMTMIASALAYSTFFAIPAVLLTAVGVFSLVTGPGTIDTLIGNLASVMPAQSAQLLHDSLVRLDRSPSAGIVMTVVGLVLALWATTGAMSTYMTALNLAYERKDRRGFVSRRVTALALVACIGFAFLLVAVLLVFGPTIEEHAGRRLGMASTLHWLWWSVQWPILVAGLLAAFATLLWLGPDVEHPSWRFLTPGSLVAVTVWLATSAGFAFYTSSFASYNKTWGSLSAVIVMLTWLWLTSLALLFGAELNAEVERSRELRQGGRPGEVLQLPSRA
jgi:membrane protein